MLDRMLRVDHAGELGANYIYKGQQAVLGSSDVAPVIQEMWEQEKRHLAILEKMIPRERVRPSLLQPLWQTAGYILGVGSALLGKEAAMACTEAVEESIVQHYNSQIRELLEKDDSRNSEITQIISVLRDEELEHQNTGIQHHSKQAPLYSLMTKTIKVGCGIAISVAERI
jgi:ubiquinone biosynthesis monooxygenase Coq7